MPLQISKDERHFRQWVINFSNVLFEIGKDFDLQETEIVQFERLVKSVENDAIRYEMGINEDIFHKYRKKQQLLKDISGFLQRIKKHSNYSSEKYAEKLGF